MIYIGTSGYSYDDWIGSFYPERTPKNRMLDHYARHFDCVELNYTYYTMPNVRTIAAIGEKTPVDFHFTVKAHQDMTHSREAKPEAFAAFQAALQPLVEKGKLGCVLAQFPGSFPVSEESRAYLRLVREQLAPLDVVVEFRHRDWVTRATMDYLRELGLGYCCVDEPPLPGLMPPVAGATSRIGYVRFHGRNAAKWWQHEHAWDRYSYLYTRDELEEWVPKVRKIVAEAEDTYVFFNNHYNAQAVQNASLFAEMLLEGRE